MTTRKDCRPWAANACLGMLLGMLACGDESKPATVEELVFSGQVELLPDFSFDSGLQPSSAPVQASFALSAHGSIDLVAVAAISGSHEEPTLSGLPGRGTLEIGGAFTMEGRLVVDVTGLPSYDGPIPGIENVSVAMDARTSFDPFARGKAISLRADIPAMRLPEIPLPAGLPGSLVLEVAEGSLLDVIVEGQGACVEGGEARYTVSIDREGVLVLRPSIEVDLPLIGKESFEIPDIAVDFALGTSQITLTSEVSRFGAAPSEGDHVVGKCTDGTGTGGEAGDPVGDATDETGSPGLDSTGPETTSGDGEMGSTSSEEEDTDDGRSRGDDACRINADCAEGFVCMDELCLEWHPICDSGVGSVNPEYSACLSRSCCAEMNVCTNNGTDPWACVDCMNNFLGGELCDAALECLLRCV